MAYGQGGYASVEHAGKLVKSSRTPVPVPTTPGNVNNNGRPREVQIIIRSGSATGDRAHFNRQLARRAWNR